MPGSMVDAYEYEFSFFPRTVRLELPSQFSQIKTIYGLLQDCPIHRLSGVTVA